MKIYRAYYDSRNFSFEAYSKSDDTAIETVLEALHIHTKQCNLEPDWFMFGDQHGIEVDEYQLNKPYRDRSIVENHELLEMRGD
jgi:hypothetical protein